MLQIGVHAVISIVVYLLCIGLSFYAVKAVRIEKIVRRNHVFEAQLILLFAAIALGYLVASFVLALIDNSLQLSNFF